MSVGKAGETVKCAYCTFPLTQSQYVIDGQVFTVWLACGCGVRRPGWPTAYLYRGRIYPGGDKA